MDKIFNNSSVLRQINAISSKSEAHRYLICAALGDKTCEIVCTDTNADIDATADCMNQLGASVTRTNNGFIVEPITQVKHNRMLDCNESGSTLRFLLPLSASLGANCRFMMHGRLPGRPLSPLYETMEEKGILLSPQGSNPLEVCGKLSCGDYRIAANVSSQYISGLLFALSVANGESTLTLEGNLESAPYVEMTVDALKLFGADIDYNPCENSFSIKGKSRLCSPHKVVVGGDWSNAAFFLCAGVIGNSSVTLCGLDQNSRQGDREIVSILKKMGARITIDQGITAHPSRLHGIEIDAGNIPDLIPILATVASVSEGQTVISHAERLRLKESDRIESVCHTLRTLGADIIPTNDGMIIRGKPRLTGGHVDSYNDHRIAMSAAIASLVCDTPVRIDRFEAINKSYPSFAENFQ